MRRRSFPTPAGAIRDYVAGLPGDKALVALKRWKPATFDRRDRRMNRLFVTTAAAAGDRSKRRPSLTAKAVI